MAYFTTFLLAILMAFYSQPFWFGVFSQDTKSYCEYGGIYYRDIDTMYQKIMEDNYSVFSGMEYSYICNVNEVHVDSIVKFPTFTIYGITRGNVDKIPTQIDQASDLERLQIQDQKLTSVPDELGNLKNLKVLKLGGNRLAHLNPAIANLKNLEALYLYRNRLQTVPDAIGELDSLRVLDLRHNRLTQLPKTIANLSDSLERLHLGGNYLNNGAKQQIQLMLPQTTIYF